MLKGSTVKATAGSHAGRVGTVTEITLGPVDDTYFGLTITVEDNDGTFTEVPTNLKVEWMNREY